MAKRVKGSLFLDYVRMIRKLKDRDWAQYLTPADLEIVNGMILPSQWYPLETYQRMGSAVLHEIANGDVRIVRAWGRASMDALLETYKNLVEPGRPLESLNKFQALRRRFFDFEGLEIKAVAGRAEIGLDLAFNEIDAEAFAHQLLGSFERLLEASGATQVNHAFAQKAWAGDPRTVIELGWE